MDATSGTQSPPHTLPVVMTFAASDPTSGGGLQADILTIAALGAYPLSVVTGITLQDTAGIDEVQATDGDWVVDQARVLLEDVGVGAFKIGLLSSVDNVAAVAEVIADYPHIPLVFDPLIVSSRGDPLVDEEILAAMTELLLPLTTILTPNSIEVRRLAQEDFSDSDDDEDLEDAALPDCAHHMIELGCSYVLVTGAHEPTRQVINTLYGPEGVLRTDAWERLPGSFHGAGCTLASAIAVQLALGLSISDAVNVAQRYTWETLAHGLRIGMGQLIPDRFFTRRRIP